MDAHSNESTPTPSQTLSASCRIGYPWLGQGHVTCHRMQNPTLSSNHPKNFWTQTNALAQTLKSPEDLLHELDSTLDR